MILVDIKGNFEEQAQDWRDNWSVLVNADSQKLLPLRWGCKFKLKKQDKLRIDLKHLAYYILLWIACVDDYCNLHYVPKAKHSKYLKRTEWDKSEKKFKNAKVMHRWHLTQS